MFPPLKAGLRCLAFEPYRRNLASFPPPKPTRKDIAPTGPVGHPRKYSNTFKLASSKLEFTHLSLPRHQFRRWEGHTAPHCRPPSYTSAYSALPSRPYFCTGKYQAVRALLGPKFLKPASRSLSNALYACDTTCNSPYPRPSQFVEQFFLSRSSNESKLTSDCSYTVIPTRESHSKF